MRASFAFILLLKHPASISHLVGIHGDRSNITMIFTGDSSAYGQSWTSVKPRLLNFPKSPLLPGDCQRHRPLAMDGHRLPEKRQWSDRTLLPATKI